MADTIELEGNLYSLENARAETRDVINLIAKAKANLMEHNVQALVQKRALIGFFTDLKKDHLTADMLIKQEDLDQLEQQ